MNRLVHTLVIVGCFVALQPAASAQDAPVSAASGAATAASPDDAAEEDVPDEPHVTVPRTACEGNVIRAITFSGNERVEGDDMLATMHLRRGATCTDTEVSRDARALWDLGYFDDIVVEASVENHRLDLAIRVHERPSVARVRFDGNSAIEDNDISEKVTIRDGAVLSLPDIRENTLKIRDLYAEKGYFLAQVHHHLVPQPHNEVEVHFDIDEGERVTVRRMRFVGNANISDAEIQGIMQTSETGFFSFITSNNNFRRDMFDEDVNRLQALYYDHGFLTVSVGTPRIELTPDRRNIDITVPINEGPRFRISQLQIKEVDENNDEVEPLDGRRHLREQISVSAGDWFTRTAIAKDLLAITRSYHDKGYAHVDIRPETSPNLPAHTVGVVIAIQRGPLVHIERVNIQGNVKTRDIVIRRELVIFEGDLYSQSLLERSKARVQALGYFERIDVAEEEGSSPDQIILTFTVVEKSTGTFQVGAGFSSIESFIFTAQVQQNNLFGLGHAFTGQAQVSGIRQLVQFRYVEPYLFGSRWTASGEAFKTLRLFQNFQRNSTGASLTLGHPIFSDYLRLYLQYTLESVQITARTGGFFASGNSGINIGLQLPLANLFRDGLTSSVRLSLTWDSRDNRLFPTRGIYTQYSTEVADSAIGSQNTFVRHRAFFRWYYPVLPGVVLKMNTEAGLITSRDPQGVPIFERFFLGGILDVRGFPLRTLGPRAGLPLSVDPNQGGSAYGEPFGGNLQFFYNLELEFAILESVGIKGVIFTDGGNTWNLERNLCQAPRADAYERYSDPCRVNPLDIRQSWGFGLRWFSPMGPLRFEWGFPFRPGPGEKPLDFEFTIGNFF